MALGKDLYGGRVIPTSKSKDSTQKSRNVVYSWGSGYAGKLGHGSFENLNTPKMI